MLTHVPYGDFNIVQTLNDIHFLRLTTCFYNPYYQSLTRNNMGLVSTFFLMCFNSYVLFSIFALLTKPT